MPDVLENLLKKGGRKKLPGNHRMVSEMRKVKRIR